MPVRCPSRLSILVSYHVASSNLLSFLNTMSVESVSSLLCVCRISVIFFNKLWRSAGLLFTRPRYFFFLPATDKNALIGCMSIEKRCGEGLESGSMNSTTVQWYLVKRSTGENNLIQFDLDKNVIKKNPWIVAVKNEKFKRWNVIWHWLIFLPSLLTVPLKILRYVFKKKIWKSTHLAKNLDGSLKMGQVIDGQFFIWLPSRICIELHRSLNQIDIESKSNKIERFLQLLNQKSNQIETNSIWQPWREGRISFFVPQARVLFQRVN